MATLSYIVEKEKALIDAIEALKIEIRKEETGNEPIWFSLAENCQLFIDLCKLHGIYK